MPRIHLNTYACKLRLLQYGLVEEAAAIKSINMQKGGKSAKDGNGSDADSSEDEDPDDFVKRRDAHVKRCIKNAIEANKGQFPFHGAKNPVAAEQRKSLIRDFLKDVSAVKKCGSCSG